MECPAYFSLKLKDGTEDGIQAKAGGGVSVAEAGHGDTREIFCTEIKTPTGKPPRILVVEPPKGGHVDSPETAGQMDPEGNSEEESDSDNDSDAEAKVTKNQYYRHAGWLKQINGFIEADSYRDLAVSKALRGFIEAKPRLTDPVILNLFMLPDLDKTEAAAPAQEKKKAREAATKARNAKLKTIAGARFTFRIEGELLLKNHEFREWWKRAYADEREKMLKILLPGSDGFAQRDDEGSTRLTPVFPHIPGVPGGGTYCPLASFDKVATQSFGLGKHTLSMSLTTTERAAAALKWLLNEKGNNCSLGKKLVAVFWAVPPVKDASPCPHDFAALLNEPDAMQVLDFFKNIHGHAAAAPNVAQFYCAILSSPKSRITLRSWHTDTLGRVTESAEVYFDTVSLPDAFQPCQKKTSTLGELAAALVPEKSKAGAAPANHSSLLHTALFGTALPHAFLRSALTRQRLELAKGRAQDDKGEFESRLRARTAIIKLYFHTHRPELIMNEQTHDNQNHPAYLCGRVLALLDKVHNAAHGKSTASSPAGRYYGSASSTPALVFPRLCKLARIHLEKIENKGWAYNLDRELSELISQFSKEASWPRTLSLEDQGRFAIGFYYERAPKPGEPVGAKTRTSDNGDSTETETENH
jgi:CRISPR-associated protein Csd1